jgi:hypothetical protein
MESWRKVWRDALAPLLPTKGLEALQKALIADDKQLIQGSTTSPPPLQCVEDYPLEGACGITYPLWKGEGLETVGQVENRFAQVCYKADHTTGVPGGIGWFFQWFDETPREEMRRLLLEEVQHTLSTRSPSYA